MLGALAPSANQLRDAVTLYRELHHEPELSGHEHHTADRIADALDAVGLDVVAGGVGGGTVGVLQNGSGPTVLVRAELDALPVTERTDLAYASATDVMHACGHDAHLASVVGAARLLSANRDAWTGRLVVVGQPAEETLSGAAAMVDDGLYERVGVPETALAQHICSLPAGMIGHLATPIGLAACAGVVLTITGPGGHAGDQSRASCTGLAAELTMGALQAGDAIGCSITVTAIHSGRAANVLPENAILTLSVRGPNVAAVDSGLDAIRSLATSRVPAPFAAELQIEGRAAPPVLDDELVGAVRADQLAAFGAARIVDLPPLGAAEDFGVFGQNYPVRLAYWMVGATSAATWRAAGSTTAERLSAAPANHSAHFAPDPVPTLRTAIIAMVRASIIAFARR